MLEVEERRSGNSLCVHVKGELDSSTAAELRTALAAVGDEEAVIVDLHEVPFMDSAGLGALIGGIRRFRVNGTSTALSVRRGAVQRLLVATGFDRIVPLFASVEEARAALAAGAEAAQAAQA